MRSFTAINILKFMLLLVFAFSSMSSFSSNITVLLNNTGTLYSPGIGEQNDLLVKSFKNNDDISFNSFNRFELTSKPLTIYNGISVADDSLGPDSAKLIIIQAELINLSQEIRVIGKPADLLIISPNNITCSQCSFTNIGRVTIANATYFNDELQTIDSGIVTINDLTAPGIQSLEVIAERINLAGTINTNFRADIHPENGMFVTDNGAKVIGGGGVNLYPGRFLIDYNTLQIKSAQATYTHTVTADISSASIAITSPNTIDLPSQFTLNTANDAISSSVRNGQFYAPLEGIFLNTLISSSANIDLSGKLITDNSIALKSFNDINIYASNNIITKDFEVISQNVISNAGSIQTTNLVAASKSYINTGNTNANIVTIEVDTNIFNSYGGEIKAKTVTLIANDGSVINGSRSEHINYTLPEIDLILNYSALEWGLKSVSPTTGSNASNLSAHILANNIYIEAKRFENINPYYLVKPSGSDWDDGIMVNNHTANQVVIEAENNLKIKAHQYILNSSAIMGLNQQGNFHVSTPLFANARYHLKVDSFKYTQVTYNSSTSRATDINLDEGVTTKIIEYSPPGRVYSFGEFKFSTLDQTSINSTFSNEFSYAEFFDDSYFYQTNIKTIGLEVSNDFTSNEIKAVRSCLVFKTCNSELVSTTDEAETLLSFNGNLYGIDNSLPTQSDLEIKNINVYDVTVQNAVKEYQQQFYYTEYIYDGIYIPTHRFGTVLDSLISDDVLITSYRTCVSKEIIYSNNFFDENTHCQTRIDYKDISDFLDPITGSNEFSDTAYSYDQLFQASQAYINTLPINNHPIVGSNIGVSNINSLTEIAYNDDIMTIIYLEQLTFVVLGGSYHGLGGTTSHTITIEVPLSTITPYIQ